MPANPGAQAKFRSQVSPQIGRTFTLTQGRGSLLSAGHKNDARPGQVWEVFQDADSGRQPKH